MFIGKNHLWIQSINTRHSRPYLMYTGENQLLRRFIDIRQILSIQEKSVRLNYLQFLQKVYILKYINIDRRDLETR